MKDHCSQVLGSCRLRAVCVCRPPGFRLPSRPHSGPRPRRSQRVSCGDTIDEARRILRISCDGLRDAVTSRELAEARWDVRPHGVELGQVQAAREPMLRRCRTRQSCSPHQTGWSQELVSKGEPKPFIWLRHALVTTEGILNLTHNRYKLQGQWSMCTNQYKYRFSSPRQALLPTKAPTCELSTTFQLRQPLLYNTTPAAADYTSSRFRVAILVPLGLFLKNENVVLVCFLHQQRQRAVSGWLAQDAL